MNSLFFLSFGLAAAVTPENIRIIQEQSAIVAEVSLDQLMNECMLNQFCTVGVAEAANNIPERSLARALVDSYYVIDTVLDSTSDRGSQLRNLDKVKSAYELGNVGGDEELCDQVFVCEDKDFDLELPNNARTHSVDCSDLSQVCPGLQIGCTLCGMFLPGTCAATCPLAGMFCGGSGYLCKLAKGSDKDRAQDVVEVVPVEEPRNLNPKIENVKRFS